ncbi:hypothetical protein [Desulfoplanes formicivorans]|uniref:Uncharacterized protein n=1 Tax=Desulfoplanes formicivorans TaxID=1592317 RepID=A0A194AJQ6_9BACT|nr:hypothetical protein [Desulfoplanes formicivorans]GAU08964.1 hypothetical protein DPF_1683 [Desulfoplanes formicivorans]
MNSNSSSYLTLSRYQINQSVKSALVRHFADLSQLDFTTTKNTVYLNGILKKDPSGDFSASGLEAMLREIVRIPGVRGLQADLDNWLVSYSGAGFDLHKKARPRASSGMGQTVRIARQEDVGDVLQDMPESSEEERT